MSKKSNKRLAAILSAVLTVLICLSNFTFAAAAADGGKVSISDKEDWLEFARRCRTDSYSEGIYAELTRNIDLTGEEAVCIPIFCGTFNGNGFTVSGVKMNAKTDMTGLFRMVDSKAVIKNLRLDAEVTGPIKDDTKRDLHITSEIVIPNPNKNAAIGLLCGENRGRIYNCAVSGSLTGYENLGGIVGINNGIIAKCSSTAEIRGTYNIGGIAGINNDTICSCNNSGKINTAANEKATGIGGIAGLNENVVTGCENNAEIGYLHTGYNVGGVIGLSRGFVRNCKNTGTIFGRRDAGGIIGQKEPFLRLEYGENTLEILDNSITGFSDTLTAAMETLQKTMKKGIGGMKGIVSQMNALMRDLTKGIPSSVFGGAAIDEVKLYIQQIRDEISYIKANLPENSELFGLLSEIEAILNRFNPNNISEWPHLIQQLKEKLSKLYAYSGDYFWLAGSLERISESFGNLVSAVMNGFQDIEGQSTKIMEDVSKRLSRISSGISALLNGADSSVDAFRGDLNNTVSSIDRLQRGIKGFLNGSEKTTQDISAQVSAKEKGMTVSCKNSGNVSADYNVGGIIGNMSTELTPDQEDTELPDIKEIAFTDTTLFIRATVYKCRNSGNISSKYDYTGGILGYGSKGALKNCENCGNITSGRKDAGGIAGYFEGVIQSSYSIGLLEGEAYVGGIAGDASAIEGCAAVPVINSDGAYIGAIAGFVENIANLDGNLFANGELGGVNGISYTGKAEALSYKELMDEAGIPKCFGNLTVRFRAEGEILKEVSVPYGKGIGELPVVERRDGKYWRWNEFDSDNIRYNQTVDGEWKNLITTLSSAEETPLFLAEGEFDENASLVVKKLLPEAGVPLPGESQTGASQTGSSQAGAPQTGSSQTGAPQTGSPQIGEPETKEPRAAGTDSGEADDSAFDIFLSDMEKLKAELSAKKPQPVSYTLKVENTDAEILTFRYLTEADGTLYQIKGNEKIEIPYARDGQYIVFKLDNGGSFLLMPDEKLSSVNRLPIYLLAGGAFLALAVIIILVVRHKKHRKTASEAAADEPKPEANRETDEPKPEANRETDEIQRLL